MQGNECNARELGGSLAMAQKADTERRIVRAKGMCGRNGLPNDCLVPWAKLGIDDRRPVHVGPAIKTAGNDAVQFVGGQVITKQVATVFGRIESTVPRRPIKSVGVASAGRNHLAPAAVEFETHHRGTARILFKAHVAGRTLTEIELAVGSNAGRFAPVCAVCGKSRDQWLQVAAHRGGCRIEAHPRDAGCLGDIQPTLVQIDAIRSIESGEQRPPAIAQTIAIAIGLQ